MAIEVKIPSLGESITSGILSAWHVKDGDYVEKDQLLYELETDKITSEGHAESAGKISLKASADDEVEIGKVVAEIDTAAAPAKSEGESKSSSEEKKDDSPKADAKTEDSSKDASSAISPAVRRIAEENGIDPSKVKGSGKDGRVLKGDMLEAVEQKESAPAKEERSAPAPAPAVASGDRVKKVKMTPLRRKIAERLVASQRQAAILTTFNEADMSAVMKFRKEHQEDFVARHGVKLGFMSFFIKAVVNALKEVPRVNAQIEGDMILENQFFDIGVAVGTDKGLIVPVLRDCDQKSFADLEAELVAFAKKAREGKIGVDDLQGGSFTISNGGVYGSLLSTPIINPPQSGILGMHTIQQRPVAVKGEVVIRPMMYLALSYDHRLVDGKEAVTFLVSVKNSIENPSRLLFGL